jgi:DamX protein
MRNNDKTPSYVAFYGMQRDPFNPGIENELFFPEPVRKQRLDNLLHLAQFGNELMIITGPKGSGKSTLLKQFQYKSLKNWVTPNVDAQGGIDERKFLQQLYHSLGLKYQGATYNELLDRMQQHLHSYRKNSQLPVLLIDNAEQLPFTALKKVLEMATLTTEDKKPLVRVILFATEKIIENLKVPQLGVLAAQPMRTMDLPPFNEEQTVNYIKHRLSAAGFTGKEPFTESTLIRIYKESYGWPALISQLSHDLLARSVPSKDQSTMPEFGSKASHPMRFIAALIIIAIVGIGVFYQDLIREQLAGFMETKNSTPKTQKPQAQTSTVANPPAKPSATSTSLAEQLKQRNPAYKAVAKQETKTNIKPATSNTPKIITPTLPTDGLKVRRREDWILLQNPDSYTMQLTSGQYVDTIRNFIDENHLKDNIAFYSTTRKGKPWHVLIYGIYDNKDLAIKAISRLPKKLQRVKPWIRQLKDIQKDIRKIRIEKSPGVKPAISKPKTEESLVERLSRQISAPTPTESRKPEIPQIKITRQEDWILRQKGRHFTLQLMADQNMDSINRFVNAHNLKNSIALYHTTREGKTWYVLIYGIFTNEELAKTAISHLPSYLQELKPSVHQFREIQQNIRKFSP